jgi:hypothetical protein
MTSYWGIVVKFGIVAHLEYKDSTDNVSLIQVIILSTLAKKLLGKQTRCSAQQAPYFHYYIYINACISIKVIHISMSSRCDDTEDFLVIVIHWPLDV